MRHLLSEISEVADPALPIDQAGYRVTLALRGFNDWSSIMVRDVVEAKWNSMAGQDVSDGDAEGGPRKLDEGEHEGLYDGSEVKPQALNVYLSPCGCSWRTISARLAGSSESAHPRVTENVS